LTEDPRADGAREDPGRLPSSVAVLVDRGEGSAFLPSCSAFAHDGRDGVG
jgi:hypothetical protein